METIKGTIKEYGSGKSLMLDHTEIYQASYILFEDGTRVDRVSFARELNDVIKPGAKLEMTITPPLNGKMSKHRFIGSARLENGHIVRTYLGNIRVSMYGRALLLGLSGLVVGGVLDLILMSFLIQFGAIGFIIIPLITAFLYSRVGWSNDKHMLTSTEYNWK